MRAVVDKEHSVLNGRCNVCEAANLALSTILDYDEEAARAFGYQHSIVRQECERPRWGKLGDEAHVNGCDGLIGFRPALMLGASPDEAASVRAAWCAGRGYLAIKIASRGVGPRRLSGGRQAR